MHDRNPLISAEELHASIGNPKLRIVDCRFDLMRPSVGRSDYLHGHLPGAVYANLDKDLSAPIGPGTGRHPLPEPATLAATFGRMGIGTDTLVVVYDDCSGAIAARAWWLLGWLGHEQALLLEGGFERWQALGLPLDAGEVSVSPQDFAANPRDELILETEEIVQAGVDCSKLRLVDARDAMRFRGETEPIDTVGGHIPGAVNLPFSASLNSDGRWKGRAELKRIWSNVLGDDLNASWSVMCGSGVTACHLAISAVLAGLREPRLYVGSWSEWITDPTRSVASGGS